MFDQAVFEWPDYRTPPPETIHAIGMVSINWCELEFALEMLIWSYMGDMGQHGQAITTHIPSVTRLDILKNLIGLFEPDARTKEDVEYAITMFNIVRENRNLILHSTAAVEPSRKGRINMRRLKARGKLIEERFSIDVETIRAVADEIRATSDFITRSMNSRWTYYNRHRATDAVGNPIPADRPRTYAERPPLPNSLTKPAPPNHKAGKRQRRSSPR